MHINDIQHFDITEMYILANNMFTLNVKHKKQAVNEIMKISRFLH